jgi:hypothetical protein
MTDLNTLQQQLDITTSKVNHLERIARGYSNSNPSYSHSSDTEQQEEKQLQPKPSYDKTKEAKLFAAASIATGGSQVSVHESIEERARRYAESTIEEAIRENEQGQSVVKLHGATVVMSDADTKTEKTYRLMQLMEMR